MASIKLKDYLVSLTSKSNAADADILPLLDSTDGNNLASIKKGTLTDLDSITGWTEFSSSVEGDIFALSFASSSNISSSLQQQIDINNLGTYTASLKQAISVSGTDVQIIGDLRAQNFFVDYITSSVALLTGSNEFGDEPTDNHTFIGRVYINGDGPIGLSQLNSFSGSQLSVNSGLSSVTGAFSDEFNEIQNNISSFNSVFNGVSAVTGAFSTELNEIQNNITSFSSSFNGVSEVTGAFSTELGGIQNNISSFNSVFSGVSAVTGAFSTELGDIQTTLAGHRGELSGLEAFTASLDDTYATDAQVADAVAGLNTQTGSQNSINSGISAVTGAFSTELGEIQNNISSFNGVFSGVSAVTGAFSTELGEIQNNISSFNSVFSGVSAVTGAFSTELGEIQTQLTNRRGELNGLEAYTASLKASAIVSSSQQIQNYNLFAETSSANTFYGNQTISGSIDATDGIKINTTEYSSSLFVSSSVSGSVITLTKGDSTTQKMRIPRGLGYSGLGWARYDDTTYTTASAFSIADGVDTKIPCNGSGSIETHLHSSVPFFNPNAQTIQAENEGDVYVITFDFNMKASVNPSDGDYVRLQMNNTVGTPYTRVGRDLYFVKNDTEWHSYHEIFQYYSDSDFVLNGNEFNIIPYGVDIEVADVILFIQRSQNHSQDLNV